MNIHDIEMPDHWQAFQYNEGWDSWEQVIPSAANKPGVVKAYTADQVIAAIEADRKRRGEPVYQVNMKGNGWEDCSLDRYEAAGRVMEQDAQKGWKRWERRVLWSAPQPAEPVKAQSDDERAAQGLPPYNPRLPTDEEMKRLTENGRKAWGKDDTEPVRVPNEDGGEP